MAQAPRKEPRKVPQPNPHPQGSANRRAGAQLRYAETVVLDQPAEPPRDPSDGDQAVRRVSDNAMPWLISGLVHLGIILLVLAIGVTAAVQRESEIPPPETPTLALFDKQTDFKLLNTQLVKVDAKVDHAKAEPAPNRDPSQTPDDPLATIGIAGPTSIVVPGTTTQHLSGRGDRGWFDDGEGDDPTRPGGGTGRAVVYLIDASGSMAEHFLRIQRELVEAMQQLEPTDRFAVLFFQDQKVIEYKPAGLRPATRANINRACEWAGVGSQAVTPRGSSDPLPALQRALAMRPGEVWVLSDNITGKGRHALEAEELLSAVDRMQKALRSQSTRINSIQFLYPDPHGTLAELSRRTGGIHRFVQEGDL